LNVFDALQKSMSPCFCNTKKVK